MLVAGIAACSGPNYPRQLDGEPAPGAVASERPSGGGQGDARPAPRQQDVVTPRGSYGAAPATDSGLTGAQPPADRTAAPRPVLPRSALAQTPDPRSQPGVRPGAAAVPGPPTPVRAQPELYRGTERFVGANSFQREVITSGDDGEVVLNFADADIREVVRSVIGDLLGANYVIDPEIEGTVTIQTTRPVTRDSLLPVLESVLRLVDAAIVREGDIYKIVRWEDARFAVTPLGGEAGPVSGFGAQVVPLRYVSAAEMAKVLEPFAASDSILRVDSTRNLLILAGTREELSALLEAVELFDVDWFAGMSFGLFPLENADPETMISELQLVFAQGEGEAGDKLLRMMPVERLNAILAISPRAGYLDQVRNWIGRLDQVSFSAGQRVYVYYVQNGRATALVEVLREIFGLPPGESADLPAFAPDSDPVSLSTGAEGAGAAVPAAPALSRLPPVENNSRLRIIADESTNAIVVLATPSEYRLVEEALRKLDIVPLQVLIEATIIEVTLIDGLEYGVRWFFDEGDSQFAFSDLATGAVESTFPGFSYLFKNNLDVRVVINALSEVTDLNVVSSPQLLVLDNQTAELQVGDEVPIATQSAVSVTDADAPVVNSIEFRETGVILRVTPRVNTGGLVVMEVEQEVSDAIETTTSGIDSPTIRERRVLSSIAIQSGETVALGGLIRESTTQSKVGVPVLSEIPVVGNLFGTTDNSTDRTELLILITPRAIRGTGDARQVTDELRRRMRAIEPLRELIE